MTERQLCENRNRYQVRTSVLHSTFDFSWLVKDFSKLPYGTTERSLDFYPVKDKAFYATLEKKYFFNFDPPYITTLTFYLKSEGDIHMKHNVTITDSSGEKIFWKSALLDRTYDKSTKSNIFRCSTAEVVKYCDSTNDQILIFKCIMETEQICTESGEKYTIPSPSDNLSVLVDNLKVMYTASLHTDINLQVGDEVVRVHKSLLCARSPVFARMFELPMEENEKNAIAIHDIELNVLKDFLEFLYTGNLRSDDFEPVYSLYYAADKYDVSSLLKMCVGVLLSKMDVENSCRVLSLANRHSDGHFKGLAMDFILIHFDEIVETDSWEEFVEGETKLAAEVMKCYSKKRKAVVKSAICDMRESAICV